jgi:hypothetical protein
MVIYSSIFDNIFVQLGFYLLSRTRTGVTTDKESSTMLAYYIKDTNNYTERLVSIKNGNRWWKWNEMFGEDSGELKQWFVFNLKVVFNLREQF